MLLLLKLGLSIVLLGACLSCVQNGPTEVLVSVPDRMVLSVKDLEDLPDESLVEKMGDDLPWTRSAAAQVLSRRGAQSIPLFINALSSEDWHVVRAGQDGLRLLLRQARKDKDEKLRKAALTSLPKLRTTLKHKHYYVRLGGLECMLQMGPDAAVAIKDVSACLNDSDYRGVAPCAVRVLGSIGLENADKDIVLPALGKAVRSTHLSIRGPAVSQVTKLDEESQRKLVPDLLYTLDHQTKDGFTRFHTQGNAAKILHKLKVEEALPLMIAILGQDGWGESHRVNHFMPLIIQYGPKAAPAIPHLEKTIALFEKRGANKDLVPKMREAIKTLKGEGAANEKK